MLPAFANNIKFSTRIMQTITVLFKKTLMDINDQNEDERKKQVTNRMNSLTDEIKKSEIAYFKADFDKKQEMLNTKY